MKQFLILIFCTATITGQAQQDKPLTVKNDKWAGVWSLISVENTNADGSKAFPYGTNPVGMLVFNADGTYAIQIMKSDRPPVVANDKNKATPEENAALVQGNNSHFGRYAVNEKQNTITFFIDYAFYPNWQGTQQVRQYILKEDNLEYTVTNTTNGGAITASVKWQRKR